MTTKNILPGNAARLTATITALPGHGPLAGTTAKACVTDWATGESTALPAPAVAAAVDTVTVTADWAIPDDQAEGVYTITIDTDGPLVAAVEKTFKVDHRREPVVP